jgi:hypothetical protein
MGEDDAWHRSDIAAAGQEQVAAQVDVAALETKPTLGRSPLAPFESK